MFRKKLKTMSMLASALILVFFGPANADVKKGPYLIYDGVNTEMTVLWQLDTTQSCTIEWGENDSYLNGIAETGEYGSDHQHIHTITDLDPGTQYFYQVSCPEGNTVGNGSFHAAPLDDAGNVKFMVYGDTRTYPADHDAVNAQMIKTYTIDPIFQTLTLHVGDWVNNGDLEGDWTSQFFNPAYLNTHEFQANMPINGCKGNHENTGEVFYKYFPYLYETGGYPGDFYWSFDYGPAHIVIIDQYASYSPGSDQYNWLANDLATSDKEWKFLVLHEPGWSAYGGHGNDTDVQNYIQPLALENGVDIIFAGHNHYYARAVVDGIQHITTGGGGAPLRTPDTNSPYVVAAASLFHFCEVNIQENQLYFTARDNNGSVIDEFNIVHSTGEDYANIDIPVKGTISGSYADTHSSDDVYEAITERQSGGKRKNRYSLLEHKWTINVTGGEVVTFYVEAYKTSSTDGDDFTFSYSTNDSVYTDMITVTKTNDNDVAQSYHLPSSTNGTVYIRVKDTDRTQGHRNLDTIYIDNMYIKSEDAGVPDIDPPTPDPMDWKTVPYATSDSSIVMEATTANDVSGVEYFFECIAGGGHNSEWQDVPTYEDTGLQPDTEYTYKVKARDKSTNQNETDFSSPALAKTESICTAETLHVNSILAETVRGSKGKKYGKVTVTIYDDCGSPVSGAGVTGTFTGDYSEQLTGTTGSEGTAVIVTSVPVKKPSYNFCVDVVSHSSLMYDSSGNVETCKNN